MVLLAAVLATQIQITPGAPVGPVLLRYKFRQSDVEVDHESIRNVFDSIEPLKNHKDQTEVYDSYCEIVQVKPNGDAVCKSSKTLKTKPLPGSKLDDSRRYALVTSRGLSLERGPSLAKLTPVKDDDVYLPFPEEAIAVGASWEGSKTLKMFGTIRQKCTLTRVEEQSGTVYGWIDTVGEGQTPESTTDVKVTSTKFRSQRILDITHGRLVSERAEIKGEMSGPQTLPSGFKLHDVMDFTMTINCDLVR